jgi:RimJ/RimL family protein N-acetyltransferase
VYLCHLPCRHHLFYMVMSSVILETPRLILRLIDQNDCNDLLQLFEDPVAMRYFPSTRTREETVEWIGKLADGYVQNGFTYYACIRKDTSTFIGYCGLFLQEDVDDRDEIEIGYGLIRAYWHQGFATEAAEACKQFGFSHSLRERLVCLIRPENVSSIKIAMRIGMKKEKDIFRWNFIHGVYSVRRQANASDHK